MEDPATPNLRERLLDILARSLSAPLPAGTPRRIHGKVTFPGKATSVIGMRRAGKTTFLHQVRRERLESGVPRERLPYVNFESESLAGLALKDFHPLVEEYYRLHPGLRGRATVTWCFDEIQVVPGWERFVRRLLDSEKVEVFLSGSSAALLSREIATSMRGRAWTVRLHPFSFEEWLRHHGRPIPARPGFLPAEERSALEANLLEYLRGGGFPEAQGLDGESRARLLRDYVDVVLMRDVVERHGVTNVAGLRWLVRHLLGNAGGLFSVSKFHAALRSQGLGVSKTTVHEHLGFLEDCFLVRTLWVDSDSERRRMVNPRKAFPVDPAFIPLFDPAGRENRGRALETLVHLELERRWKEVTYVRTGSGFEVDFLARGAEGEKELIQVAADASDPATAAREIRALEEAGREHPGARRRLLTLTRDSLPPEVPRGVVAQSAADWLLGGEEPAR